MYTFEHSARLSIPLAFLASLGVVAAIVAIIEWTVIRPAVTRISHASLLMLMGGLLTAFEGGAFLLWGSDPVSLRPFSGVEPLHVGGLLIAPQAFWVLGATALSIGCLAWLMTRTSVGKALRATAENRTAALLIGVPADRMILLAFVAAAVLGVIAGAVIAPLTQLDFATMTSYTTQGLIAVTLGGLGSIFGSVAGGLVLGVVQALVSGYVSSLFSTAISLVVLIAIIVLRPQGLLGRGRGARADVAERASWRIYSPPKLPRTWSRGGAAALVVLMLLLPQMLGAGDMRAANITGCFCLTIIGLDLLTGIAGQVSLGQAAFMAVGGYAYGILTVRHHVPPLAALAAGVAASAAVAGVLGAVSTRLRGLYLAIVTLAFGILVESVANGLNVTGGPSGLVGVPVFSVAGFAFDTDTRFYYLIWGLVGVSALLVANLVRSGRGRILRAMNGDDVGARSLGLRTPRAKAAVFILSACLAAVAGSLYASYFRYLSPDMVGSQTSLEIITMLVIGGMGTLVGPMIGVALLTYLPVASQSFANYAPLVTGVLLVLFLRYLPGGLYGAFLELVTRARRVGRRAPAPPVPARAPAANGDGAGRRPAIPAAALNARAPALRIAGVSKSFGGVDAVRDVSFDVPENSICALIGPNGAGKSTLFNLVTNLYRCDAGRVDLWGDPITGLTPDRVTSLGLFRTFQTSRVFPQLTVLENVLVGGYGRERAGYLAQALWTRRTRAEERALRAEARRLLEVLHLDDRADDPVSSLSFARHKYVELARALMAHPRLLLLDEPGAGMNDAEIEGLAATLGAIRDLGHTVLVVEHNMSLVMGIAESVVVMDAGRLLAQGPPTKIQQDEAVVDAYFGRAEAHA
ncbi:MAG: branched-chain amino acid transport system ATP-binding protein livM [Solirubrobacteraceae bacterium]|jgi:branched-chain amino acid transport system permease protein|nr:branched-chain amino acid transport system ATP-binding protein livM [Solirubrobacteraceae bacterium]